MSAMFNINKCNITVEGRQCGRNRKSGRTQLINGELVCMCQQHYDMVSAAIKSGSEHNIKVYHFTGTKPVTNHITKEEEIMNTNKKTTKRMQEIERMGIAQLTLDDGKNYITTPKEGTMKKYYELELEGGIHKLPLPRHITLEESLMVNPIINFDLLTDGINRAYDKSYKLGQTHMVEKLATSSRDNSKPGYIFTGSDYMGYIGHNGENFVMVFDRGKKQCVKVDPIDIYKKEEKVMKTKKQIGCGYCHGGHDTADEVAACGGKVRVAGAELTKNIPFFRAWQNADKAWMGSFWFPTKNEAEECRAFYDVKTFKPAKNGHGYWVHVHPAIVGKKGDFHDMVHAYKTHKAFNKKS